MRTAGYIITLNESERIERAIRSLGRVCDSILIVDSGSDDNTIEIAHRNGCDVVIHPFSGFASQRNYALQEVARSGPAYVITIDADEWMDDELVADINRRIRHEQPSADAYLMRRRVIFDERMLRWGGFSRTALPRIFRLGCAKYEAREVNEHLVIGRSSSVEVLRGYLINDDVLSWDDHMSKYNRYSSLEAGARVRLTTKKSEPTRLRDAMQRSYLRRRWIRETIWDRLPGRPALRFLQIYVFYGGFLDGRAGFRRALLDSWLELCIDLKTEELLRSAVSADAE